MPTANVNRVQLCTVVLWVRKTSALDFAHATKMRPALLVVLVCLSDNETLSSPAPVLAQDTDTEAPEREDPTEVPAAGDGKDAAIKAEVPDVPDPPATQAAPPAGPPVVHACPPPELDKFPRARHNQHRPVTIVTITSQALPASLTPRIRSPISA